MDPKDRLPNAPSTSTLQLDLEVQGRRLVGTLALAVLPGTRAVDRDRFLDDALRVRMHELATELGVALVAAPCSYARPRAGKDAEGRVVFDVVGRCEGDRLVPERPQAPSARTRGRR